MMNTLVTLKWSLGRRGLLLLLILPIFAAMGATGCGSGGTSGSGGAATQPADPLIGRWAGETHIIVNWTQAHTLAVQLDIQADGGVTGKVGDATLKDGVLGSTHPLGLVYGVPESSRGDPPASLEAGDHFQVTARLDGPLIAAEQVSRDGVIIVFHLTPDRTLRGGLTSTGSDFGGKDYMKLSARNMVLRKQP